MVASLSIHPRVHDASVPGAAVNLGYAAGNLGKSIVWTTCESFLLFYLVTVAGFPPLSAGALLSAMMVWDACADVVVGHLVDRYARPDMLGRLIQIGAPLCGMAFWAIFAIPARSSPLLLVAAVAACRIGYTLCDIGHNTLLVRVATTSRNASKVSGLRLVFSATGAGLVGLASSYVLAVPLAADRHAAFALCAMGGGVIYLATLMLARQVTGLLPAAAIPAARATSAALLTRLWHNRTYRRVLALIAVQSSLIPIFGRALPFFGTVMHGDSAWAGPALSTMTLAQALSLPGWILLSHRCSSRSVLRLAYALMILGVALLGWQADGGADLAPLVIIGIANAGSNMAIWALLARSIRAGTTDGGGSEALPIGIFLATLKGAAGVGGAILSVAVAVQEGGCTACIGGISPVLLAALGLPVLGCLSCLLLLSCERS
ncbi:MFS transporter [Sphingomonas sp. PP-CC-3G-468]|uniref:MFS transporter n=1 Tax=Sphingomonas sp. PP-CC-3G-468 TaxID=2135656 RepID=UPI00104D5A3C|nr:MFS transporter [Sphingomonas sp. PP-CC-3G-468]TCM07432.1 Na+/melibiose symporter-like transporter [Sphingomonas sp. PP-CC-3G-468]